MAKIERISNNKKSAKSIKTDYVSTLKKSWQILFFAAMTIAVWLILMINLLPDQISLTEGEIATEDYFYEGTTMSYLSEIKTEEARTEAELTVERQYLIDDTVASNITSEIRSYFDLLAQAAAGQITVTKLQESLPGEYSSSLLYEIIALPAEELEQLENAFIRIVESIFEEGVLRGDVENAREDIALAIGASTISGDQETFIKDINEGITYSYNKIYDAASTAALIEEARNNISPIKVQVQQGEKLVSKGQVVSAEQVEMLQNLRLQSEGRVLTPHIGLLILVAISFILLYLYIKLYHKEIFAKKSTLLLLGVVMVVILLICKLISLVSFNMDAEITMQIGYLLPVAAASMVLAVLLNRSISIVCTILLSLFMGIAMDGNMAVVLVSLAGGLMGIITSSRLNQRSQFVGASIYLTLVNIIVIGAWGFIWQQPYQAIGIGMLFGLINGLLSAILAMGILPYLESGFGITTVLRLLELSNSNHPLLKRLMMEAPGTYNHSILVGNLAEAAADAIGADALLVRVSSYYHDIGKLKRPHFYIENQRPGENPHDKLQPGLSAMIITSHTTDGAKMLREERFPQEIIDIVEQHHGNGLLSLFYNKAKELAVDSDEVKKSDYRYKGKKPQTKEAAVVMLADSVQAAVQALDLAANEQVEAKVKEVINARLQTGQLSESPLTFKDLDTINQSFLMVLSGMNHQRIKYQDQAAVLPDAKAALPEWGSDNDESNPL